MPCRNQPPSVVLMIGIWNHEVYNNTTLLKMMLAVNPYLSSVTVITYDVCISVQKKTYVLSANCSLCLRRAVLLYVPDILL